MKLQSPRSKQCQQLEKRYVSVYGKVCVVETMMLPKLKHIATALPNLKSKQIKEIEKHNYISPEHGIA